MKEQENIDLQEMSSLQVYWQLFRNIFVLSACTFGGGFVIISMMKKKFVEKLHWISEEEMLDIVALAQSGPGPMAISTSLLTGYRLRGPLGAIVGLIASVLPCLVIITILYYVYDAVQENSWIQAAFAVMAGAISAVLVWTTFNMAKTALAKHPIFGAVLMVLAFVASYFFDVNTALIIAIAGIIGLSLFSIVEEGQVK